MCNQPLPVALLPPAEPRPRLFDSRGATAENTTNWPISGIAENTPLSPAQPKVQTARIARHPEISLALQVRYNCPTDMKHMSHSSDVASEWPPLWRDAGGLALRSYGDAPTVEMEGKTLRCAPSKGSAFALWFIPSFSVFFLYFVYNSIGVPRFRALFLLIGPLACVTSFIVFYGVLRYNESLGDYLQIDLRERTIVLPRYRRTIDLDAVVCLQFISGYTEPFRRNLRGHWRRQLNLIVYENDELIRYHLMGNPRKSIVNQISGFAGIEAIGVTCPSGQYLCSDVNGHGPN